MASLLELVFTPLGWALRNRRSGEKHSVLARPGWNTSVVIDVRSDSFQPGDSIPDRHSALGRGDNISPHLAWSTPPTATRQVVVVFEDLDLPFDRPGLHSIGILPPTTTDLPEGAMTPDNQGIRWVPVHGGRRVGYGGPRPLPGHGRHHYRFHVLALDHAIDSVAVISDIDGLDTWVSGHVIARGILEGHQTG